MKKRMYCLFVAAALVLALAAGCTGENTVPAPADTEEATGEPLPTQEDSTPEPAPIESPLPDQSDKPFDVYDFPELAGMQLSLNAANDMFGEPEGAYAYMQAADGETFLCLTYQGAYLALSDLPERIADAGGGVLEEMTGEDKVDDLNVESVWISKDSTASGRRVRGVGIGDRREQVLAAFLNLPDQEGEGVLYTISEINPEWGEDWTQSFVGGRVLAGQDAAVPVVRAGADGEMEYALEPVDCDEVIEYTYVNDFEDYPLEGPGQWNTYASLRFFIKNGVVTDIHLFRFSDPE